MASADQSRGVADGKPADLVNFSVELDIARLVKAGKVDMTGTPMLPRASRSGRW